MKNRSYVWYHCIASLVLSVCHRRIAIGCSAIRRIMVSALSNNFFVGFQYCSASIADIRPADINMQPPIPCINLVPCVRPIFVGCNDAWNIQLVHTGTYISSSAASSGNKKNSRKQFSENTESCFRQFFMIYIKAVDHYNPPLLCTYCSRT